MKILQVWIKHVESYFIIVFFFVKLWWELCTPFAFDRCEGEL